MVLAGSPTLLLLHLSILSFLCTVLVRRKPHFHTTQINLLLLHLLYEPSIWYPQRPICLGLQYFLGGVRYATTRMG